MNLFYNNAFNANRTNFNVLRNMQPEFACNRAGIVCRMGLPYIFVV